MSIRIQDWERKAAASWIAFVAICVYAWHKGASFDQFANAIEWILGIYITGQAAQKIVETQKSGQGLKTAVPGGHTPVPSNP